MARASMSLTERAHVARRARRSLNAEVTLILTAGFSAVLIVLFWVGDKTFLPVASLLGLRPTVIWVAMGAVISVVWAVWHSKRAGRSIANARQIEVELRAMESAAKQAEIAARIDAMQADPSPTS